MFPFKAQHEHVAASGSHVPDRDYCVSWVSPQLLPTSLPGVSDKYVHIVVMLLGGEIIQAWERRVILSCIFHCGVIKLVD